jgi:alkaline phosphatase
MKRLLMLLVAILAPLAAAADDNVLYAVGDIADCRAGVRHSAAARTTELVPAGATVLLLGDAVYPTGTAEKFAGCFAPTWGRHLDDTIAVPGNHEYYAAAGRGFYQYFGSHSGSEGYLSKVIGNWLVVGLNSNLAGEAMERQYAWFAALLQEKAKDSPCLLAFWHHPLFSSRRHGKGAEGMKRFWQLLEQDHADLILNGHEHFYEAFAPQTLAGAADPAGIREIIVGTGGGALDDTHGIAANSLVVRKQYGVLQLTLGDHGYAWRFIGVDGKVGDSGSASCHR